MGFFIKICIFFFLTSCALIETKPSQEMSHALAAIHAARETNAHKVAPAYFLEAVDAFQEAKKAYQYQDFIKAKKFATRSKKLAEEAEWIALRSGAAREEAPPDPLADIPELEDDSEEITEEVSEEAPTPESSAPTDQPKEFFREELTLTPPPQDPNPSGGAKN